MYEPGVLTLCVAMWSGPFSALHQYILKSPRKHPDETTLWQPTLSESPCYSVPSQVIPGSKLQAAVSLGHSGSHSLGPALFTGDRGPRVPRLFLEHRDQAHLNLLVGSIRQ